MPKSQNRLNVSVGYITKSNHRSWRFAVTNPSASIFESKVEVQLLSDMLGTANDVEPDPDPNCILVYQPETQELAVFRHTQIPHLHATPVTSFFLVRA